MAKDNCVEFCEALEEGNESVEEEGLGQEGEEGVHTSASRRVHADTTAATIGVH